MSFFVLIVSEELLDLEAGASPRAEFLLEGELCGFSAGPRPAVLLIFLTDVFLTNSFSALLKPKEGFRLGWSLQTGLGNAVEGEGGAGSLGSVSGVGEGGAGELGVDSSDVIRHLVLLIQMECWGFGGIG